MDCVEMLEIKGMPKIYVIFCVPLLNRTQNLFKAVMRFKNTPPVVEVLSYTHFMYYPGFPANF